MCYALPQERPVVVQEDQDGTLTYEMPCAANGWVLTILDYELPLEMPSEPLDP